MINCAILTISDKGSRGEREDKSGQVLREMLPDDSYAVTEYQIVPDELEEIKDKLLEFCSSGLDLILTTGGTGVSPRDVTPEATIQVIEKEVPGMAEAMRMESMKITPYGMVSRAVVGMRGETLIVNLPGSPKAARENLKVLLPAIPHTIEKMKGDPSDCATEER
jgi:molybdenum cofactor synthesis domain-containing protein